MLHERPRRYPGTTDPKIMCDRLAQKQKPRGGNNLRVLSSLDNSFSIGYPD